MAQLQVEPKKNNNWWVWLILALLALILLFALLRGCNNNKNNESKEMDTTAKLAPAPATAEGVNPNTDDWSTVDRNVPNAAYDEITDKDIEVRGNDNYAVYSLEETILFDPDKSEIKKAGADKLKQIAASAEKRFSGGKVRIYGYTDSTGSAEHNKELAKQRAESVQTWLVSNGNISEDRISVEPVGENKAASTNATAEGRAQNRRVEVVIRKK